MARAGRRLYLNAPPERPNGRWRLLTSSPVAKARARLRCAASVCGVEGAFFWVRGSTDERRIVLAQTNYVERAKSRK